MCNVICDCEITFIRFYMIKTRQGVIYMGFLGCWFVFFPDQFLTSDN